MKGVVIMTTIDKTELRKKFFSFVIPSVSAMWVYLLYSMIDGIFVAKGVGKYALAAVNLSMPLINVAFACGILFAVGASTKASIYRGRNMPEMANKVFTIGTITVIALGIIVATVVRLNLDSVAIFLGAEEETIDYVKSYLGIIILFVPIYMTSYNFEVLIKADGFPSKAIKTSAIGAVINLILDYLFIMVFDFGISGAAIATGISQVVTFTIFTSHFILKKGSFSFTKVSYNIKEVYSLARLGFADFITELTIGITIYVFNHAILTTAGPNGIVIYTVISYVSQLILMTMTGTNQGAQPLMSFYYGQNKKAAYNYIFSLAVRFASVCAVIFFLITFIYPNPILELYVDKVLEPALFLEGIMAFRLYSFSFLPLGVSITMMGYFTSLEKPKNAMIISLSRGLIIINLALIIMAKYFGETGVWLATPISEFITLVIALFLYKRLTANN